MIEVGSSKDVNISDSIPIKFEEAVLRHDNEISDTVALGDNIAKIKNTAQDNVADDGEEFLGFSRESDSQQDTPSTLPTQDRTYCKYFLQGYCSRGEHCYFLHAKPAQAKMEESASSKRALCKYFMMGRCKKSSCTFSHDMPDAEHSRQNDTSSKVELDQDLKRKAKSILDDRSFRKFVRK